MALIANTSIDFGTIPKKLYFIQGNKKEILSVLQAMTKGPKTKDKKYPVIALFRDVKENLFEMKDGISTTFNAHLAIFTLTSPTYRADEREEKVFKKILIPIFEEFIRQLGKSKAFGMPTVKEMAIKKWDCYFYGSGFADGNKDRNILLDFVDAIDIESISLKLKNIC